MRPQRNAKLLVSCFLAVAIATTGAVSAGALPAANAKPKASAGCSASAVASGDGEITTASGGVERSYRRHVPPAYDGNTPLAVVVELHGLLAGAALQAATSELGALGDEQDFITITPQGSGSPVGWDTPFDSADMQFIGDLLDEVEETVCVDERRVFVAGKSNGAFMTSAVACVYAGRVAAVATVAGIRIVPGCKPDRRVPVVAFHGTADQLVTFTGETSPAAAAIPEQFREVAEARRSPTESGKPIPAVAAAWAKRNGCSTKTTEKSVASDVTLVRWKCPPHAEVHLYEIEGGGHTWPGSELSKSIGDPLDGATTLSIDASDIMWEFFEAHPLRGKG